MRAAGVSRIVFSSTAAVYGIPEGVPITEDSPTRPINPYGFTKLVIERAIADYARAYGLGCAALRYFNACGAAADGDDRRGPRPGDAPDPDRPPGGPRPAAARRRSSAPTTRRPTAPASATTSTSATWPRRTGSVLERIEPGRLLVYNVGTGAGASVREVLDAARRVTGRTIPVVEGPRRAGDPPVLVAAADAARRELGWSPRIAGIEAIVASAWKWHSAHPDGFGDRRPSAVAG